MALNSVQVPQLQLIGQLAEQLDPAGMEVFDDGSNVQLAPEKRFHEAVVQLVQSERLSRLTQEQAEVLAIVVMDGTASDRGGTSTAASVEGAPADGGP